MGCGVRVLSGERTGYAYTDDLAPERILHAARTAALIASGPAKQPVVGLEPTRRRTICIPYRCRRSKLKFWRKVELVFRADKAARAYDSRIKEVRASYADELRRILVMGSDGSFAEDVQPLARMSVFFIARDGEQRFGARKLRRRRTRRVRILPDGKDARTFCQRGGAPGDRSA